MAFVISNVGEKLLLDGATGAVAAGNLKLRLYTNNYTPLQTSVVGDFTEMGAVEGYALKTLTAASWPAATAGTGVGSADSNKASSTYAQQTFSFDGTGGSVTVYGYYITDSAGTILLGAEIFSSPKVVSLAGDAIKITPKLKLGTE